MVRQGKATFSHNTAPRAVVRRSVMNKVVDLVCHGASTRQWTQWLRVPLEHAAATGNLALVKDLLAAGADGRAGWKGCRDRSLLCAAVQGGNDGVVSALLKAGSKPDVNVCCVDKKRSPLHYAAFHGRQAIANMLLLAGANVKAVDRTGQTPLHLAIRGGNVQVVCLLLMTEAVNVKNGDRDAPLHMAISSGQEEMVAPLLLRGAEVDVLNNTGQSPLLVAAKGGYLSAVRALLTAGADVSLRNGAECSALELAAAKGHVDVIRELLQYGANAKSGDSNGWTPLHAAVAANHASAVDVLADAGAGVNASGGGYDVKEEGMAYYIPLHLAVANGAVDVVLALLRHQANLEGKDDKGRSPLIVASQYAEVEVVDILLRWGADETVVDMVGQSAIDTTGSRLSLQQRSERIVDASRVRKLLAGAPSDRAWRRRGLLILCRALAEKRGLGLTSVETASGSVEYTGGVSAVRSVKKGRGAENNGTHNVDSDASGWDEVVASTVEATVVELEQDNIFRAIVSFL